MVASDDIGLERAILDTEYRRMVMQRLKEASGKVVDRTSASVPPRADADTADETSAEDAGQSRP